MRRTLKRPQKDLFIQSTRIPSERATGPTNAVARHDQGHGVFAHGRTHGTCCKRSLECFGQCPVGDFFTPPNALQGTPNGFFKLGAPPRPIDGKLKVLQLPFEVGVHALVGPLMEFALGVMGAGCGPSQHFFMKMGLSLEPQSAHAHRGASQRHLAQRCCKPGNARSGFVRFCHDGLTSEGVFAGMSWGWCLILAVLGFCHSKLHNP